MLRPETIIPASHRPPIASFPETQPFVEMRQAARRRQDRRNTARGILFGVMLGSSGWAVLWYGAHTIVTWAVSR